MTGSLKPFSSATCVGGAELARDVGARVALVPEHVVDDLGAPGSAARTATMKSAM